MMLRQLGFSQLLKPRSAVLTCGKRKARDAARRGRRRKQKKSDLARCGGLREGKYDEIQ
jgi:hypothetical protein